MNEEKLPIPYPDEKIMQQQIRIIVNKGMRKRESLFSFLKSMYKQIGLRHLFSDHLELIFSMILVVIIVTCYFLQINSEKLRIEDMYSSIFLISPIIFLVFSLYTYYKKTMNATFEVEMTCKYNVYQIIAFRMLLFSIVAIFINTSMILILMSLYEHIQFFRAFLISLTGLFLFSVLFSFAMMRRRSLVVHTIIISFWIIGNLILKAGNTAFYTDVLIQMPLIIYAFISICCVYFYMKSLNKLIHYKQKEGAL